MTKNIMIMENQNEEEVIVQDVDTTVENADVETEEQIDWKAKYEAEEGRRKRLETKLAKFSETKSESRPSKSDELDYGQKAFLLSHDLKVKGDELKLVKEIMSSTGKSLDDVLESKYFQAELKEMRELKATADATPSGSKRSSQSSTTSVDYWIAKGELPPASEVDLRRKVINARMEKETKKNVFYNS